MNSLVFASYCFRYAKIQNLSAIHNQFCFQFYLTLIVSDMQRYKICQQFTTYLSHKFCCVVLFQICKDTKFVSNSQLPTTDLVRFLYCFRYAKIQNLSAIHNCFFELCDLSFIVSDMQRYKICQQFTTPCTSLTAVM